MKRYLGFYLTCLAENISGAVIWYYYSNTKSWFTIAMTVFCVVPFILGCIFMMIYHLWFHPKHYIPPNIIPQKRRSQVTTGTQQPNTPSPKAKFEPSNVHNGTIPHGSGDRVIQTGVEGCTVQEKSQQLDSPSPKVIKSRGTQDEVEPDVGKKNDIEPVSSKC